MTDHPENIGSHTWTMDDDSYSKLPDRSSLTGSPMVNQAYRDSTQPGYVFRFFMKPGAGTETMWQGYRRVAPTP